jgi:hypothetical protein
MNIRMIILELVAAELLFSLMAALLVALLVIGVIRRHEPGVKAPARKPVPMVHPPRRYA